MGRFFLPTGFAPLKLCESDAGRRCAQNDRISIFFQAKLGKIYLHSVIPTQEGSA